MTGKLNNDKIIECLKEHYDFNLSDFYKESGKEIIFYPEFIKNKDLIDEINNLSIKYNNIALEHKNTINEIYSSTSWKITKPLRTFSKLFRLKNKMG